MLIRRWMGHVRRFACYAESRLTQLHQRFRSEAHLTMMRPALCYSRGIKASSRGVTCFYNILDDSGSQVELRAIDGDSNFRGPPRCDTSNYRVVINLCTGLFWKYVAFFKWNCKDIQCRSMFLISVSCVGHVAIYGNVTTEKGYDLWTISNVLF